MELRQLRYFITVADETQFVAASRKLLISQPALSQQIKLLEQELGIDLFIKAKRHIYRKVELTQEGALFLKDAKQIIALADKAKQDVMNRTASRQRIKLGIYRLLIWHRVTDTLDLISKTLPELDIEIVELPTFINVQEALLNEEIDFGISVLPLRYKELDYIELKKSKLNVILPASHPLALKKTLFLKDFKQEKWIEITTSLHPVFEEIELLCKAAGFTRKKQIVQEVSSLEVLAQLVSKGKGLAFVPTFFDSSFLPTLVNRKVKDFDLDFIQCLVFRKKRHKQIVSKLRLS